jgi:hypothetical protein
VRFGARTEGVPEILPVAESNASPEGKEGLICHEVTVPWVRVGEIGATAELRVNT